MEIAEDTPARYERIDADRRRVRIWDLGVILHDASRDLRISAAQDWRVILSPTLCRYPMPDGRTR